MVGDYSGRSVSAAGDVNGDGFADLIIGALGADPNGSYSGASYVVFGKAGGFDATLEVSAQDGTTGFQINGEADYDFSGRSVSSAGDVNNDGFDDLIVGADRAAPNGTDSGASYVIFGRATAAINRNGTSAQDRLFGGDYNDKLNGLGNADLINAGAGNDKLSGSAGRDTLIGGTGRDMLSGGTFSDSFEFASGDSGQAAGTMDKISDFEIGAVNVGDSIDFMSALTIGGSSSAATISRASINQTTGVVTFAAGSGESLADALNDIAKSFTASGDCAGEFALFQVGGTGAYHVFISDGMAGVTSDDVLVQLTTITSIGSIDLTAGDITVLS